MGQFSYFHWALQDGRLVIETSQKNEGQLPKMLNSLADGTRAGGLSGPLAWLVNRSSTRGRTRPLQPSG